MAVKHRRLVLVPTVVVEDEPLSGYISGADDFHWVIVDRDGVIHLVHKTTHCLSIHPDRTLAQEPDEIREPLEAATGPYRTFVLARLSGED